MKGSSYCFECKRPLVDIDNRGQRRIGSKKAKPQWGDRGFKSRRVLGDGDCEVTGDAHEKLTWRERVPPKQVEKAARPRPVRTQGSDRNA